MYESSLSFQNIPSSVKGKGKPKKLTDASRVRGISDASGFNILYDITSVCVLLNLGICLLHNLQQQSVKFPNDQIVRR